MEGMEERRGFVRQSPSSPPSPPYFLFLSIQRRSQSFLFGGFFPPFPSSPSSPIPSLPSYPFPPFPYLSSPLIQLEGLGSAVSSPSGVLQTHFGDILRLGNVSGGNGF